MTIWVAIDATLHLDKLVTLGSTSGEACYNTRKAKRTIKDIIDKELTIEFCQLFDVITDVTQITCQSLLGTKYLQHQENYMVDVFLRNLEEPSCQLPPEGDKAARQRHKSLFDLKEFKCSCTSEQQQKQKEAAHKFEEEHGKSGYVLSLGETFIQYYYLCQRKVHRQYEQSYIYAGE